MSYAGIALRAPPAASRALSRSAIRVKLPAAPGEVRRCAREATRSCSGSRPRWCSSRACSRWRSAGRRPSTSSTASSCRVVSLATAHPRIRALGPSQRKPARAASASRSRSRSTRSARPRQRSRSRGSRWSARSPRWSGIAGACAGLRRLAFPLGFLLFMVPLPEAIVFPIVTQLQMFASAGAVGVLHVFGRRGAARRQRDAAAGRRAAVRRRGVQRDHVALEPDPGRRAARALHPDRILAAARGGGGGGARRAARQHDPRDRDGGSPPTAYGAQRATSGSLHDSAGLLTSAFAVLLVVAIAGVIARRTLTRAKRERLIVPERGRARRAPAHRARRGARARARLRPGRRGARRAGRARDFLREWLARGYGGEMAYLARNADRRADPRRVLPGARSVIALGLVYDPGARPEPAGSAFRVARYAGGDDYHDVLLDRVRALEAALSPLARTPVRTRGYVDTGPVLERAFAADAGLGWIGKNTLPDRSAARLLSLPRRRAHRPRARAGRARARSLRKLPRVPRRVPDRRVSRALRARRDALSLVHDDRAARADPRAAARAARRLGLRLRRVPGGVPVEPARTPRGSHGSARAARAARAARRVACARARVGARALRGQLARGDARHRAAPHRIPRPAAQRARRGGQLARRLARAARAAALRGRRRRARRARALGAGSARARSERIAVLRCREASDRSRLSARRSEPSQCSATSRPGKSAGSSPGFKRNAGFSGP